MELIGSLLQFLRQLVDQDFLNGLVRDLGPWFYVVMFAIIFAETGLVVTPFLPGDSLLFALGAVAASPASAISLPLMIVLLIVAAVLGDAVNYSIGYRVGPAVFRAEGSWLFNRSHLFKAQAFYERYGSKTIILARFVPIVRTFAPFVAGIGRMNYSKFGLYNVIGGVAWVLICTLAGVAFGRVTWVKEHFEVVVLAIILISVLPMAIEFLVEWRRRRRGVAEAAQPSEAA